MVTNYYTLRALAGEWSSALAGGVVGDAFSQARGELALVLAHPDATWTLRFATQAPFHYVFRHAGYHRPRRNVATCFEAAFDRRVAAVRLAERDRILFLDLDDGSRFQAMLFGPRANVLLVDEAGVVVEAFRQAADVQGRPAPAPRPAPDVATPEAFEARWPATRKTAAQAVAAALPLFDRTLAAEVLHRAGVADGPPEAVTAPERRALFEAAAALRAELGSPAPCLYRRGRFLDVLALVPLRHLADLAEERFATVDEAVRVFVRRTLAQRRFREAYEPLAGALADAAEDARRRVAHMLDELDRPSRADRYERWGHLLMASARDVPAHADAVTLPDLFTAGASVTIPLDPARSVVENAQRYYDKARRTRQARERAEERVLELEARVDQAEALLGRLERADTFKAVDAFRKEHADALAAFVASSAGGPEGVPFRRYTLDGGYEVWVGRNAKQNDALTFRYAQKYDLWLHARGVAGSHAVLRLPHRTARPDRRIIEQAAAVAAYHSKARGSALVPVIVVPRKYVRKPRGAPPGTVVVEREEVVLVEPLREERRAKREGEG